MFSEFVKQGWNDHAERPQEVLDRLVDGLDLAEEATHLASLATLGVHVAAEHLGAFDQGTALLDRIEAASLYAPQSGPGRSIARSRAMLLLMADRAEEAEALLAQAVDPERTAASVRAQVYAVVASMRGGRGDLAGAERALATATLAAEYGPTAGDPAARALAITGNNLACALEEAEDRDAAGTQLMKRAAAMGRTYWEIAGDWTNVALAEVRLCFTHLAALEPQVARTHAEHALALADANEAGPDDRIAPTMALANAQLACGDPGAARAMHATAERLLPDLDGWLSDFYTPIVTGFAAKLAEGESASG